MKTRLARWNCLRKMSVLPDAAFLLPVAMLALALTTTPAYGEVARKRQGELLYFLKHDCGSCHGLTRKGGLGSPLLPELLAGRDDDDLTGIILDGVPGTPMPPWRGLLTEDEARWMVRAIKQGTWQK